MSDQQQDEVCQCKTCRKVRESFERAELPCPECGSDDYWITRDFGQLTVHRCLECGGAGAGPGGFVHD